MFAITFLIALYLSQRTTSIPTHKFIPQSSVVFDNNTLIEASACTFPNTRSVWDIVWSCVVTIFACSWVSVHPDIPGPEEKWWIITRRRLQHMAWGIVAPEFILWWAARQWFGARSIAREQKDHGWTVTHGHFLQMGRFMLYDGEERRGTLSYARFKTLLSKKRIHFPKITQKDIKDRSKSDVLQKLLVIGQTGWFILQCISRGAERLPLTGLELSTLALAALNVCMYFFWWDKPFGVQVPISVQLLTDDGETASSDDLPQLEKPFRKLQLMARTMSWSTTPGPILRKMRTTALEMAGDHSEPKVQFENPTISDQNTQEPMQVPNFYALIPTDKENIKLIGMLPAIGTLFGGIHCIGWFFSFPTRSELLIWRFSSIYISGLPLLVQACGVYFATGLNERDNLLNREIVLPVVKIVVGVFVGIIGLPLYTVARFLLLAESLATLRELPPRAYLVVSWTSFLPHI